MLQMAKCAYAITRVKREKRPLVIDKEKNINSAALYIYHLLGVSRWKLTE